MLYNSYETDYFGMDLNDIIYFKEGTDCFSDRKVTNQQTGWEISCLQPGKLYRAHMWQK